MARDTGMTSAPSQRAMQLISSLHLQKEPDGGAHVIDDRTLMAAHLNKAACILLEALHQPRTQEELVTVLAEAADCDTGDAVAPVAQLIEEIKELGWIEFRTDAVDNGVVS